MMKRWIILGLCLGLGCWGNVTAQDGGPQALIHDGLERTYFVHLPRNYDPNEARPLVVVLHGAGATGFQMMMESEFNALASDKGYIVVYPDGLNLGWSYLDEHADAPDDVGFIAALLDTMQDNFKIDAARVYLVGYSNGGLLALRLRCQLSERLAGVAVIAAMMSYELAAFCDDVQPMPFMLIMGTFDEAFPWQGYAVLTDDGQFRSSFSITQMMQMMTALNRCRGDSRLGRVSPDDGAVEIVRELYSPCAEGAFVELYALLDLGHVWPGNITVELDNGERGRIRDVIWGFFERIGGQE